MGSGSLGAVVVTVRAPGTQRSGRGSGPLTVLNACAYLIEYLGAVAEVAPDTSPSEALRSVQSLCEMTDVGSQGDPVSYSTLYAETYE